MSHESSVLTENMAHSVQVFLVVSCLLLDAGKGDTEWYNSGTGRTAKETLHSQYERGIIVETKLGLLEGIRVTTSYGINGTITDSYEMFRGIPYALPPVGSRRFEAPEPAEAWHGVHDATRHGAVCPQDQYIWINSRWPREEDCLYLSVYTPYMSNSTAADVIYPVIFFIHGGSYEVGSERMYDGGVLSMFGVVVVMINYRLGLLGFVTSGNDVMPGNYGLLDQIEALKWVKNNIRGFRGDPDNISIMGQSVGASSVGLLMISPLTKGLFHKAIMHSGAVLARYSYQSVQQNHNITEHFMRVGRAHGCPYEDIQSTRDCLKKMHWKRLIFTRHQFPINDPIVPEFRPFIDGYVLPRAPEQLFRDSDYWKVPTLHGVVKDEMSQYTYWDTACRDQNDDFARSMAQRISTSLARTFTEKYGGHAVRVIHNKYSTWTPEDDILIAYTKVIEDNDFVVPLVVLSDILSQSNPHVYQYYFSAAMESYHLVDLYYIFGTPFSGKQCCHGLRWFDDGDKATSATMMKLWTSFAATGRVISNDTEMPPYSTTTKHYLHIAQEGASVKSNLLGPVIDFWTLILPSLTNSSNKAISPNRSGIAPASCVGFFELSHGSALTVILGVLSFLMALTSMVLFIVVCRSRRKRPLQNDKQHTIV